MKIARIICLPPDSTLRPTFEPRIWYHSGLRGRPWYYSPHRL